MTDPRTESVDLTRPLALGYLRAHLLMTDEELDDLTTRLSAYVRQQGYALGTVFVEQVTGAPAAFHALLAAVRDQEATAVVVPSMQHFSVLGASAVMKQHLEHHTNARVLIAGSKPEQAPTHPPSRGSP